MVTLFVFKGYAQQESLFYLGSSLEVGNHLGLDINLNYVYQNKYSFSIGALGMLYENENYPDDIDDTDSITIFDDIQDVGNVYFSVGRVLVFSDRNNSRLNLSIGLAKTWGV